jgi:hypothetical protein
MEYSTGVFQRGKRKKSLKGQSHKKVGEIRSWKVSLGSN